MLTDAIWDLDLVVSSVLTFKYSLTYSSSISSKTILILDRIKVNVEGFKPANLLDLFSSHLDLLVLNPLKGLNPNRLI